MIDIETLYIDDGRYVLLLFGRRIQALVQSRCYSNQCTFLTCTFIHPMLSL